MKKTEELKKVFTDLTVLMDSAKEINREQEKNEYWDEMEVSILMNRAYEDFAEVIAKIELGEQKE